MSIRISGISSMATRTLLADVVAAWPESDAWDVRFESVGGVDAARRIIEGEAFDLVVLADDVGLAPRRTLARVFRAALLGGRGEFDAAAEQIQQARAVSDGQAAASSRIENYLGFPLGLSGADLTGRAAVQAMKFGAQVNAPCEVSALQVEGEHLRVTISDDAEIETRAVIIATGARYRSLALERWDDFVGAGIYYAATELEVRACAGQPTVDHHPTPARGKSRDPPAGVAEARAARDARARQKVGGAELVRFGLGAWT